MPLIITGITMANEHYCIRACILKRRRQVFHVDIRASYYPKVDTLPFCLSLETSKIRWGCSSVCSLTVSIHFVGSLLRLFEAYEHVDDSRWRFLLLLFTRRITELVCFSYQ